MPQPRQHGGAELIYLPLMVPGFKGLNKQQSSATLGPEWATVLTNAVIDDSGRLSARKGWNAVTTVAVSEQIVQSAEFIKSDGTTELVVSTPTKFYKSTNSGSTWTDVTGTISFTDGNWHFMNFNDRLYAIQAGKAPCYYTGTGNFTAVADVNAPKGGIGMSAFGRLWITATNGYDLHYSGLLDGTDWTSVSSGVIGLWSVWPENDQITAVSEFNGLLTIFSNNSIVFYTDGAGSALGFDPVSAYVSDIVRGTGCKHQNSIRIVDGDLWFLSDNGLQTLGRVIQERSNPLDNLSKNVQDYLAAYVASATLANMRSAYSPRDRVFLLSLPSGGSAETGVCFAFDTRGKLDDGSARCVGLWTLVPTSMVVRQNGNFLMSRFATIGKLGRYTGALDDASTYGFEYNSGWIDLTQAGYIMIPKRYEGVFFSDNTVTVNYKWAFDFDETFHSQQKSFTGALGGGEWGLGEWGLSEFGGGISLRKGQIPASGTGQYIKLGITCTINNSILSIQKLTLFTKIGRLA